MNISLPRRMAGALLALSIASPLFAAAESERQYLSGKGKDDAIPWDFFCTAGQNANTWSTIKVPSNWELQGFGTYTYGRDRYPAPAGWPKVQGRYKRNFDVPANWNGKHVFLVFDGAMTDTQASVNGKSAGPIHQGGYYRFRYEITSSLNYGAQNLLDVSVDDESANPTVNAAERRGDYWNHAGIFRPVYLEAVPQQYIDRVAINAKADGSVAAEVALGGLPEAQTESWRLSVEAQVLDLAGNPVGDAFSVPTGLKQPPVNVAGKIASPKLWNAEAPNLYQLEVRLKNANEVLHTVRKRFGFRTIETVKQGDNAGVYVNGSRIMFKGVNRHSFYPDSGRCLSEQLSREDVMLMKEMNMNAVRMSHYPPDEHFLDVCDELGLYVLDELAGWHAKYDTTVGRKLVEEMVTRDVNHPSILFWDNGNEGGNNAEIDDDFAKWDIQKREVLHPWALFRGIDTKHYPNWADLMQRMNGNTVYFPTEMLHGLYDGGAGASLEDYWNAMRKSKVAAGGFIWVFSDEDIKRSDKGGILDSATNQAPDGIVGPYREREGSFYTARDVFCPIAITRGKTPADGFAIENRYDFIDASACTFMWEWRRFKRPEETGAGYQVTLSGKATVEGSIPPRNTGKLLLQMPDMGKTPPHDALAITAKDPTGRELWTWVWQEEQASPITNSMAVSHGEKLTATSSDTALTVTNGAASFEFHKKTGGLSVFRGTRMISLYNGPRLVTGTGDLTSLDQKPDGQDILVDAKYTGDLRSIQWRIKPNGWITMDYAYHLEGPHDFFGIGFDYSENNVRSMRYLGEGPSHVWKNRLRGGTLDVWERPFNNIITGDPTDLPAGKKFDYPEFKGFYAGVRWLQLETSEGPITAVLHQNDMYVQVLTPQFPPTRLQGKTGVNFPSTGIAFLNAIPPVGSKFVPAAVTGPSSQQAIAQGDYKGSVSLFFGPLPK